jgi:transcriptional regulator with XRE-family HTH domain
MGKIVIKIRQARLRYQVEIGRDVSVQEVASAIGISRTALSNIERSLSWPSKPVLEGLCAFYKAKVEELVEYVEELLTLRPALV